MNNLFNSFIPNEEFQIYINACNINISRYKCRSCENSILDLDSTHKIRCNRSKIVPGGTRKNPKRDIIPNEIVFNGWTHWEKKWNNGVLEPKKFTEGLELYRHTCWNCFFKKSKCKYAKKKQVPPPNILVDNLHLVYDISESDYNDIRNAKFDTASLSSFIKRHGKTKGTRKYKEYQKLQAYAGNSLEYFQAKYGDTKGIEKYSELNENKTKNWIESTSKHSKYGSSYSKVSMGLFEKIKSDESMYKDNEFKIVNSTTGRNYFVDFYNPSTKKVIEFNGDFWHANPSVARYTPDSIGAHGMTSSEIWVKDKIRLDEIKSQGYEVLVVWENEYANDPVGIINKCIKYLEE